MRRASVWLMIVLFLFPGCIPSYAVNSHGPGSVVDEFEQWWGDAFESFIPEGCLHAASVSVTITLPLCRAFILETTPTRRLRYAAETTPRTITLNNGDGIYWLAIHKVRDPNVGGWTTVQNTHYLWQWVAAEVVGGDAAYPPTVPDGMVILSQTKILAGAVTWIGDHRPDSPMGRGRVNVMAPLFQVERDCVTNDLGGIQQAINNAAWRNIYRVYLPAPELRGCYAVSGSLWASYDAAGNPMHPGRIGAAMDGNVELFGDKSIYFGAQAGVRTTGSLLKALGPEPVLRSDPAVSVNGARLISVRDLAFRGASTTQPAILLDGSAGVTIQRVSCWQSGEGGSCIWLKNFDRAWVEELVMEGPRTPTTGNPPTAGSVGLWMRGEAVDNSGSVLSSVHMRGFDRCMQIGENTPITVINNNAALMTHNSITMINCNIGLWGGDGATNHTFNSFQANGMFDVAVSLGHGVSHWTFVGGAINASIISFHIGRDGTYANNIRVTNMRISNIRNSGSAILLDSTHSLSKMHVFEQNRFHCTGGLGTVLSMTGAPRGGIWDLNGNDNCATEFGGANPGSYELFDRVTTSELSTHFGTGFTNVNKLRLREPDGSISVPGMLQLWQAQDTLNFPVVVANTCSAELPIAAVGVADVHHYPLQVTPDLATLGLRAVVKVGNDLVNVRLCNDRSADSADPPAVLYQVTVIRVQ